VGEIVTVPILEATGLVRQFGGLVAVDCIDLAVIPGEIVGLFGPNGAGKTTLFNLIAGAVRPDKGKVVLDGEDITQWSTPRRARAGLARTFQIVRPFRSLTVLENLLAPINGANWSMTQRTQRANQLLEQLDLVTRRDICAGVLPLGILKRLELARAMMLNPRVLLLDEPLAGLSRAESEMLLVLAGSMRAQCPIVLVEHNVQLALSVCDRAVVMERGRVIAEGTPEQIRCNEDVIEAYLGRSHANH
jgi:branched-chain amino acid transport system ATP-binding protein